MGPKRGAGAQQAAIAVSKKQRADDSEDVKSGKTDSSSDAAIIEYLTSATALDEISPEEILGKDKEKDTRYPQSDLSPFGCLISALLLSKPFSHRLGMRAIHTVLNDPYSFTTPKKVADAGGDDRWQALMDAHTLHKEKTSGQLRDLAAYIKESYADDYDSAELEQFRSAAGGDVQKLEKQCVEIKGFGAKTAQLFFRRVQLHWDELFPYADDLALEAAREIGLSSCKTGQDLADAIHSVVGGDEKSKDFRRTYINAMEVLIGKKLDKDIDQTKSDIADDAKPESKDAEEGQNGDNLDDDYDSEDDEDFDDEGADESGDRDGEDDGDEEDDDDEAADEEDGK